MRLKWKVLNFLATSQHKAWVAWYLFKACLVLLRRAAKHDLSKYTQAEAPYFERTLKRMAVLEYGTSEYLIALKDLGPALEHHYRNNSHHPQYWGQIDLMGPLDQIEMLCDWKAAGKRHKTGNMAKSLASNRERFQASDQFHDALERDAHEIGLL